VFDIKIDVNACPAIIREAFVRLNFSAHQALPLNGNHGRYVYIVLFGEVKVKGALSARLHEGTLIGSTELFVDETLNLDYIVQENTNVLRLDEHKFLEWIKMDSDLYQKIMQGLAHHLERSIEAHPTRLQTVK
jgi:CRP-like cAMP-binding protein